MATNEMATNEEILKFMKDISGKFDSLKEDVEGLKSSGARVETPTAGTETPTASGANASLGTGRATPHRDSSSGDLAESEDSSGSEEEYETYAQVCRKGKRPRRRANLTINKGQGAEKQQPQAKRRRADPLTDTWADRMELDVEDPMDYSEEVTWDDETPKLREVSEKTNTKPALAGLTM